MRTDGLKFPGVFILLIAMGAAQAFAQQIDSTTPKEIIANSFKALENQKSWFSETVMTNETDNSASVITVEFLAPNSSHSVWTYQGKVFIETIVIGQDEYEKTNGKWTKKEKDKLVEIANYGLKAIGFFELKYMTNVSFAGKEILVGGETFVYRFEQDLKALKRDIEEKFASGTKLPDHFDEMKGKIWINAEGLPLKLEYIRRTEETKTKIQTMKKIITYRYDREIKIEAPKLTAGAKR